MDKNKRENHPINKVISMHSKQEISMSLNNFRQKAIILHSVESITETGTIPTHLPCKAKTNLCIDLPVLGMGRRRELQELLPLSNRQVQGKCGEYPRCPNIQHLKRSKDINHEGGVCRKDQTTPPIFTGNFFMVEVSDSGLIYHN